jgi:arsenate reductase (thioredoxin)
MQVQRYLCRHATRGQSPTVVEGIKEIGIDISGNNPKMLTFEMIENATKMITMGCGVEAEEVCTASFIETEDWALEDPKGNPIETVRKIRHEISQAR